MLHNHKRIQKIETWARWLSWLSLISAFALSISLSINIITGDLFYQSQVNPYYQYLRFWEKIPTVIDSLSPVINPLASFLLLMGISKAVRFLRAYYAQITAGELEQQVGISTVVGEGF
jgi:hypothetical protein